MTTQSILPAPESQKNWGFFGYSGAMCDIALRRDDLPALKECIARGFMDASTRMFDNRSLIAYAELRGSQNVAAYMRSLGWS